MEELLTAVDIGFAYRDQDVLRGVSLSVKKATVTGIIGPNGSGKSTFIKTLSGISRPHTGRVTFQGRNLAEMTRKQIARAISVVPQESVFHFPFSVFDFVMMGRHPYQGITPFESDEDQRLVNWALEATGTEKLKKRSVLELSGGEKQRVVLASALAQDTPVMLLDEPTASLDLRYQVQIHKILDKLVKEKGLTVIMVTHDLNLGALFCNRLVLMKGGQIVADGTPAEVCTKKIISEHYGVTVFAGQNTASKTPIILPTGD